MKELIIAKLNEIKQKNGGFSRFGTMRWANIFFDIAGKPKHISEIEFSEVDDEKLLEVFERVVRQCSKQM